MNRKHFAALAAGVLPVVSGVAANGAQAAPLECGLPLRPVSELPLTPVSQQQAVRKAREYLSVMAFSRSGLINQLTQFEGFSAEDAIFAVDAIAADWNEQAAKKATEYLSVMAFSRSGLINQLTQFEGFTPAQAAYGVATTGL